MRNNGILEAPGDETQWVKSKNAGLKLHFDGHLRLEFKGAKVDNGCRVFWP